MMSLATLPDVPIRVIFSYLPVVDLLTIDQVYLLWIPQQKTECHRRRELTILLGEQTMCKSMVNHSDLVPPLVKEFAFSGIDDSASDIVAQLSNCDTIEWSFVRYDLFTKKCAQKLVNIFPNISRLAIAQNGLSADEFEQVNYLLNCWSTKLTNLKMMYSAEEGEHCSFMYEPEIVQTQVGTINSLTSLEHLTLDFTNDFFEQFPLDLSILTLLSEFRFHINNGPDICDSLKKYAVPNEKLKHIMFMSPWYGSEEELLSFEPEFYARFTNFIFSDFQNLLISKFTSLRSLTMSTRNSQSLVQLATLLSPLTQLIELTLIYCFIPLPTEAELNSEMAPLSSVRVLSLVCECESHKSFSPFEGVIGKIVPNLHALDLFNTKTEEYFTCLDCIVNNQFGSCEDVVRCMRVLLAPFSQCTKLRKFRSMHLPEEEEFASDWPIDYCEVLQMLKLNESIYSTGLSDIMDVSEPDSVA